MKTILSHWRLAFRSIKKAISVTISVMLNNFKAYRYTLLNEARLNKQRKQLNQAILEQLDKSI